MRIVPLFLILAACPTDTTKPTGETGTYTTETDADTDADTDSDADTDTDTDTDPGTDTVLVTFDEAVPPVLTGFGDEVGSVVVDPTDASNMVAQLVKPSSAPTWAGTTISYCDNFGIVPLPFTDTLTQMSVRVWSPDAGVPVRLKVENAANNTITVETDAIVTAASTWETLVFDFANEASGTAALNTANTYDKVSIFPNFGTDGATAGEKTYYVDDVTFLGAVFPIDCVVPKVKGDLPITFDNSAITYTLTGFGGAEDAAVEVDPDDATNMVARVIKSGTAELWAGTTFSTLAGDSIPPLPLTSTELQMTARVRSPRAGIQVRLKVEDATDPTRSVETEATTTAVDTWETLTFDFATPAAGTAAFNPTYVYTRASIFFDFGTTGASGGGGTFYFDDVDMAP